MSGDGVVINVSDLTKTFNGKLKAVDAVSFEVKEREIFGFLGPNGAGKTTTIKMLTTLLRPTSGTATVRGYSITSHPNDVRASIGIVPQEYTADEDLTGRQNIMFRAARARRGRVESHRARLFPRNGRLHGLTRLGQGAA